jgi:nicotinamidase-related amidase
VTLSHGSADPIDPARAALLLMDFQNAMASAVDAGPILARAVQVRAAARAAGMRVVYVRVAFADHDYAAVGPYNKVFAPLAAARQLGESDPAASLHPDITPEDGDLVVAKTRFGAFSTSNLDRLLSPRDIDTLVLCGISTSGVVLATQREASDRDYRVVVVSDCCVDPDQELHDALVSRYFPVQADVVDAARFISMIESPTPAGVGQR